MYDIRDYIKKKEEENIWCVVDMIIDDLIQNLEFNTVYKNNYFITGYNNKLDIVLHYIKEEAKNNNIDIKLDIHYIPTSSVNIIVTSSKINNMFLRFMNKEQELYNIIKDEKVDLFDVKSNELNRLYILHALKTAFYHAGDDYVRLLYNDKVVRTNASNMVYNYLPKVVLYDMVKYNSVIENERLDNIKKKLLIK